MRDVLQRWWPFLKTALGLTILALIGLRFAEDLQDGSVWERPLGYGWLLLSGLLYLVGLFFSALTWRRLLGRFGPTPRLATTARAYYLGHLGKYLPGKAWALFLRADLVRGAGVSAGLAAVTAFYEVLVTMSAGVLLAAALFACLGPDTGAWLDWPLLGGLPRLRAPTDGEVGWTTAVFLALALLTAVGVPALPPVFNRLLSRLALPFRDALPKELPQFRGRDFVEGLLLTGIGWLVLGASLGATLFAVAGPTLPWTWPAVGRMPALLAVSYVAGFVILLAPSGLGVREFFLTLFLTPELRALGFAASEARGLAVLTVLVLRLTWTAAELAMAAAVWRLPGARNAANPIS